MPSKGKKPARIPPAGGVASPAPCSPSTTARQREVSVAGESLLRRLLPAAAAKFPALVSEAAFYGTVSERETSHSKGSHCWVWLSEAAMVSSSFRPGSLVSVSLAASQANGFPLDSLAAAECGSEAGSFFAIAMVFPSRKVLKNEVRLSWGLCCTLGFPPVGGAVFVCPLSASHDPKMVDGDNTLRVRKCKDLYLQLVPSKIESLHHIASEPASSSSKNGKVTGPPKTLATPRLQRTESSDYGSSMESFVCLDVSSAQLALSDEKIKNLLQIYASRWLNGRHLLKGNCVAIPICGLMYAFILRNAEASNDGSYSQDLVEGAIAFLVEGRTKVNLSDSNFSIGDNSTKNDSLAAESLSNDITEKGPGALPRLGGLCKEFEALKEIISFSLANNAGLPRYKGVLLYGPPGTGKTSLACSCALDAGANLFTINGPEIISQYYGESEQALCNLFDSARRAPPAVVFIDELDAIAPARKDGGEELSLRMVAALLKLMDGIRKTDRLIVIAATNRPDSIDPAMRRPGRLDREIEIGVPSALQRLDILCTLLSNMDHSLIDSEVQSLARATHGFVGADLAALCNEAAFSALRRHIELIQSGDHGKLFSHPVGHDPDMQLPNAKEDLDSSSMDKLGSLSLSLSKMTVSSSPHEMKKEQLVVSIEDFEEAKMKIRPSAMREVMLELPKVRWEDVGGYVKVKDQLIQAVQWPQIHQGAFEHIGIRPPQGLLMIGPPGCSKTLMARAVASEAKQNFLAVKGPELFSKWVGESEKAVKSLFAKARANSPAIIFFDEIDGLAVNRGYEDGGTSVGDRVLSELLVEMDGLDQRGGVIVIAATNRPDKIDRALLRPGRFDRIIDVQPPDQTDREDIFRIHTRDKPCNPDVNLNELAFLTESYTGADIMLVCREAAIAAVEESFDIPEVSMRHFKTAISRTHPLDIRFYQELAAQFRRYVDASLVWKE